MTAARATKTCGKRRLPWRDYVKRLLKRSRPLVPVSGFEKLTTYGHRVEDSVLSTVLELIVQRAFL